MKDLLRATIVPFFLVMMTMGAYGESGDAGGSSAQEDAQASVPMPLPGVRFPSLEGHDIDHRRYLVPDELEGSFNFLLVAYDRYHQRLVNTWMDRARELEQRHPHLRVYEIPLIRRLSWFGRRQLDYWMSRGISDPLARATTITIYTDVERVNERLNIPNTDDIRLFLVDNAGAVYWKGSGAYDARQFRTLEQTVQAVGSGQQADDATGRPAQA